MSKGKSASRNFAGVKTDFAGVKLDFVGVKPDSAGVKLDFAGVELDSAGVQLKFCSCATRFRRRATRFRVSRGGRRAASVSARGGNHHAETTTIRASGSSGYRQRITAFSPCILSMKMRIKREPSRLEKRARRGHRGYPLATVAFYGPDASRASKVAVGIVPAEGAQVTELQRWSSHSSDVRVDPTITDEILHFVQHHQARTVVMSPGIIGCPHEEGTDYPEGEVCPSCPYWATRDLWTGEKLPEQ